MCYFFDPRDLWNSKNFALHGVRCCVMNSPVCSHYLCFQCEGFVSNTGRREHSFSNKMTPWWSLSLGKVSASYSAILARQCRFQNVLLFRPSGSLEQQQKKSLHGVRCCVMNTSSPVCSHCLCFQCKGFVSNTGRRDSSVFFVFQRSIRSKKFQILKTHCFTKIALQPLPKTNDHGVILLENECSIIIIPNTKQTNKSVSSTMFMKLTIKVVAFFLGHPV